jgi:hypothetical protein
MVFSRSVVLSLQCCSSGGGGGGCGGGGLECGCRLGRSCLAYFVVVGGWAVGAVNLHMGTAGWWNTRACRWGGWGTIVTTMVGHNCLVNFLSTIVADIYWCSGLESCSLVAYRAVLTVM